MWRKLSAKPLAPRRSAPSVAERRARRAEVVAIGCAILAVLSTCLTFWQVHIASETFADQRLASSPDLNSAPSIEFVELVEGGQATVSLSPKWVNTGGSPTVGLRSVVGCGGSPRKAEANSTPLVPGIQIPPAGISLAGTCNIPSSLVLRMMKANSPFFMYARATYRDVFGRRYAKDICFGGQFYPIGGADDGTRQMVEYQAADCGSFRCTHGVCHSSMRAVQI